MHFLDTCICIEFLRGRLKLGYQLMRESRPENFQLPAIVVAELFFGAAHSNDPRRETRVVDAFVDAFTVVPFDCPSARIYGELREDLGSRGEIIGDRDLMIAACALAGNATLVTRNIGEFKRVPNLKLESWDETDLVGENSFSG